MNEQEEVTYFVLAPKAARVKIGRSRRDLLDKRIRSLQIGCPEILEVVLVLPHRPPFEEQQLHRRFRVYRVQGEWFEYRDGLRKFVQDKGLDPTPLSEDDGVIVLSPREEKAAEINERVKERQFRRIQSGIAGYPSQGGVPAAYRYLADMRELHAWPTRPM